MQNAETVLSIIRERGQCGLPLERLYRQLYNPRLYLCAYGKLYANKGAMTPGVTPETVDGMSLAKIGNIIKALRQERYRWMPARRTYIPKSNGKKRPLGITTMKDRAMQTLYKLALDPIAETTGDPNSYGFREKRSTADAIAQCFVCLGQQTSATAIWEADIRGCFVGNAPHCKKGST